jgi:hypothetical protein
MCPNVPIVVDFILNSESTRVQQVTIDNHL